MVAYLEPNRSVSDLGLLGMYVLPVVCNNPSNPDFSTCKLQEFHAGLLQVVAFERSRKANVVSLTELAEVDVRKQLDVVDQESKQFEIITAIQDSANKVGAKIQEESDKIQAVIKAESAAIHSDIAASTQILYTKMGEEGRALQASIDVSTKQLEETIGSAVDTIRRDIAKNTKLLYDKMTAEARALQKIIDDNTKKLATQIGAEATATRKLVADATTKLYDKIGEEGRAIRGKIDESTAKLYNKIGDEGRAIRNKIDESTDKLYNKIGEEGEKTRDKIDSATQQLTNVVNTNTNLLSSKIDESTKTVVGSFQQGFTALADYFQADASINKDQLLKNVMLSIEATDILVREFETERRKQFTDSIDNAAAFMKSILDAQGIYLALKMTVALSDIFVETARFFSPSAIFSGAVDPVRIARAAMEVTEITASVQIKNEDDRELKRQAEYFSDAVRRFASVSEGFDDMRSNINALVTLTRAMSSTPAPSKAEITNYIDTLMRIYNNFSVPMTQTDITKMADQSMQFLDFMAYLTNRLPVMTTAVPKALAEIRRARALATPMFAAFTEVYNELGRQFEKIGELGRAAVNLQTAANLGTAAKGLGGGRRLASTPFKPFYSMAYAGLSRFFMQYKLQNAAFQFCKFYEYKNGGIPPSMCASPRSPTKFYTPTDIQAMRAYAAPSLRQYTMYALIPTRPTPASGDSSTPVLPRPYLDLEALARGESVQFTLPLDDLAWLKTYSWVFPSDTVASLAGIYIQSMQLYLPYTTKPNATIPGALQRLDVSTNVDVAATQRLNSLNTKSFVIPRQTIRFSTATNAPVCATKLVNPYHEAAKCVKNDGSSTLCVFEDGSLLSTDVLPSLFSTWRISSTVSTPSDAFKLALPRTENGTAPANVGELNILALLKVVRVTRPTATATRTVDTFRTSAAGDTCCKSDEFYTSGVCTTCPIGSIGALNGYACQRLQ